MNYYDNNGNQDNGGIFSKFQERLRKIRLSRSKKNIQNQKFIDEKVKEIRETILQDPTPIYRGKISKKVAISTKKEFDKKVEDKKVDTNISQVIADIRATASDRDYGTKKVIGKEEKTKVIVRKNDDKVLSKGNKPIFIKDNHYTTMKENKINNDNTPEEKEVIIQKKESSTKKVKRYGYVSKKIDINEAKVQSDNKKEELLQNMKIEIIDKLKSCFEEKLDELEILESELYFLKKDQENELQLKKVKEIKKKINELIDSINSIIDQYNLYAKNYYIDNVIGIDDNIIVEDIINYRELLDSFSEEKKFVKDYKDLDEFKSLYSQLKTVRGECENLIQSNEKKIDEFDIRDKKYDAIKMEFVQVDKMNKECSLEIEKQNKYFKELMEKINKINREEYTTYRMRGVTDLIGMSFRYMGLMMAMPLSGLLPRIGMQAVATRRMIGNIYRNMGLEEIRHVYYATINYDSELNHHLCDVDYTAGLLDETFSDIKRLKDSFMLQYDSRIPGYDDTFKKIQKMEEIILHNQNRVQIIKKNLKVSKKINEQKLVRVRELNQKQS